MLIHRTDSTAHRASRYRLALHSPNPFLLNYASMHNQLKGLEIYER